MEKAGASQRVYLILILLMISLPLHAQVWDTIPPPLEGGFVISTARNGNVHYALHCDGTDSLRRYQIGRASCR